MKSDDLSYWNVKKPYNNNEMESIDDEKRSIAFIQLPSHLITSPDCQCRRSFHIFCTDLFHENDQNIDMLNNHPAPRTHDRGLSRRVSTPYRKNRPRPLEDNDQNTVVTSRSEPCQVILPESQSLEKKLRVPPKLPTRTTSLNIQPSHHSFPSSLKYSPSIRIPKQTPILDELQIRASSVFDQSPSTSQLFIPRGPPPSPKTPTQESSTIFLSSIIPPPLRAVSITPCARNSNENTKKLTHTSSVKITNYEDHARNYLSASDCSDDDNDDDNENNDNNNNNNDKNINQVITLKKPKVPVRTRSLSRTGTTLRDRLLTHNANHYLSLAEVYYSSFDVHKNLTEKSRRRLRAQTRLTMSNNDNDDASTTITKTTKTTQVPQSKSGFGFSKTASSMHFGYAAGRLPLQGSFEKWPQPLSHRTSIERKQEVTTLRLVTLPLVTS
ncbi:unnamed protein product [Rotaria sp. Silwood1]|nr:unnamed protein product [Rotaria sp. Silwood1]CAF0737010.1 unnamed protein product [Rotaria sp. Silwood1]CAF0791600.1 unnamed protein product [Rotaria sp. Silwood1]CAF3326858.1 unnamed protein product [Rotaria sp. Silwood1]CAF3352603.1 unnamed protein product [Rotaria sp. Silwood1]